MAATRPKRRAPARAAAKPETAARATAARDAIALAFDEIGGVSALAEWVKASEENKKAFYTNLYPKLIALQAAGGEAEQPAITEIRRTIVYP
ncbi:MAG: hypothetical protein JO276_08740 [Sphingomonadaceae bacterium]|nr:hypothetical protein [Sphingomonadaceae bacterium]